MECKIALHLHKLDSTIILSLHQDNCNYLSFSQSGLIISSCNTINCLDMQTKQIHQIELFAPHGPLKDRLYIMSSQEGG